MSMFDMQPENGGKFVADEADAQRWVEGMKKKERNSEKGVQGEPLLVINIINGVITPINGLING